jgi:lipopolysaccharide transport system ATP-binding protein
LRDVSFEVEQGEVLGIIGRNGAGKSTLLKILSQVTAPTEGLIKLKGRLASLLEVGTGFHPELTGRENIFLNGAILGMTKREIAAKFDEIVAFSEVEKFIDTPVKRYSSGMYVRLAFAVAAHLEPEVLVVDEVLAVGDAAFQKKCLGKMGDVAQEGRTVLFVSHNMASVRRLCNRVAWLADGRCKDIGVPREVIADYLGSVSAGRHAPGTWSLQRSEALSDPHIVAVRTVGEDGVVKGRFRMGEPLRIVVVLSLPRHLPSLQLVVGICDEAGLPIYHWLSDDAGLSFADAIGNVEVTVGVDHLALYPDRYLIDIWLGNNGVRLERLDPAVEIDVQQSGSPPRELLRSRGLIHCVPRWEVAAPSSDVSAERGPAGRTGHRGGVS